MNLRIREGYLSKGISVATFLTLMGSSTFLILGPVSLAPYPLVTGMAVTLTLLFLHHRNHYPLTRSLRAIGIGIVLAIVYSGALVFIGTSMIQSVLPPP